MLRSATISRELATADEQILVLKDLAIDGSRVLPHTADDWLNGKEGEPVLVNGELQPRIEASSGLLRLRLINACNARYLLLGFEDHQLTVLGAGTGFAETPATVDTLLLAPGERTDVLVALHRTGESSAWSLSYSGHPNTAFPVGMDFPTKPSVDVDLEFLGKPGEVDVELDPVSRNAPKGVLIVWLGRCLESHAPAAAAGFRPDEELATTFANELDCGRRSSDLHEHSVRR
jgi:FtsP/CotA-like multicopper oxidase with cupredoxin domain